MQKDVMEALGFYAGGAATAIGALWVAFTKLRARDKDSAPDPAKPNTQTNVRTESGVAGGRDVLIEGGISNIQTPFAAWVVLGIGLICLGLVSVFGGDRTTISNGAQVNGDMDNSTINIEK